MAMSINTNVMSLNAQRNLASTQTSMATTLQRLSSGLRVNSAKDDAAGLAIADRMNTQVRGMTMAIRNANDGVSMVQIADGGLATLTDSLQRMRELTVQALNGTNSSGDRANLDSEFQELAAEVLRITLQTNFNTLAILGSAANSYVFQVGANAGQTITVQTQQIISAGIFSGQGITTVTAAGSALAVIDLQLDAVNTERARYGAAMSRFEAVIASLRIAVENQAAARGRIMDADFAVETSNLSRTQILQQAGTAMVAQANQIPQNVLRLLQ